MEKEINNILSIKYPSSVKEAVRYGYLYRKESEIRGSNVRHCLPEASAVLLWIASSIAGGIMYDVIKETVKRLYAYLKERGEKFDKKTETILEDDNALKEFYIYIEEYYARDMKITVEQETYIKDEIIADTFGQEANRFYEETGRLVFSYEEFVKILKVGRIRAEELIHRHK